MEILAKLNFKNHSIIKLLREHNISGKRMALECGIDYQRFGGICNFRYNPRPDERVKIIEFLKTLDESIDESIVFPAGYEKAIVVFQAKESVKEIEMLRLGSNEYTALLGYDGNINDVENQIETVNFHKKLNKFFETVAKEKEEYVRLRLSYKIKPYMNKRIPFCIKAFFGIDQERLSIEVISEKLDMSYEAVRKDIKDFLEEAKNPKYGLTEFFGCFNDEDNNPQFINNDDADFNKLVEKRKRIILSNRPNVVVDKHDLAKAESLFAGIN